MSDPDYFALLDACDRDGCPVCQLTQQGVRRYLDSLFYEMVNDAETRDNLFKSLGFCEDHARLLLASRLRDPLGLTILYRDLVEKLLGILPLEGLEENDDGDTHRTDGFFGWLPKRNSDQNEQTIQALMPQSMCPACIQAEKIAQRITQVMLENLSDPALSRKLVESDGLCRKHLLLALEKVDRQDQLVALLKINKIQLIELKDQLEEFLRKSDYRFSQEGFGEESDAYVRAIRFFSGLLD